MTNKLYRNIERILQTLIVIAGAVLCIVLIHAWTSGMNKQEMVKYLFTVTGKIPFGIWAIKKIKDL